MAWVWWLGDGAVVIVALVLAVVAATWRVAEWRFGEQIAALKLQHERERGDQSAAGAELQRRTEQRERLEADLQAIDEQRWGVTTCASYQ
ncbi:hypothetical protein ACPA9J_11380 [Pseudomonas aeruginosa]